MKKNSFINTFNNMMILPATIAAVISLSDISALALLLMVAILSVVFTIIIMFGFPRWPAAKFIARATALGVVVIATSGFAMAKGVIRYEKGSILPLWFHIIAMLYVILYWSTFYIMYAISMCHAAHLRQHICRNPKKPED